MHNELGYCRVCGYEPDAPPWGISGADPSWEICPCCGVEFGYEDSSLEGTRQYRDRWLNSGARWLDPTEAPDGLSAEARLARVPAAWR